ncbi:MAG: hypothetical protein GYB25_15010 [Rhodobacteraceae bacterium]|nr:hypothetical protein [Paracoccaceae bacterium]
MIIELKSIQDRQQSVVEFCDHISMGNYFIADGLDHNTTTATMTFVHFSGSVWGITCRHVAKEASYEVRGCERHDGVWRLHADRVVYNLSSLQGGLLRSAILAMPDGSHVDLAFCKLDHMWAHYHEAKNKKAALLLGDYFPADPIRGSSKSGIAVGFPDKSKVPRLSPTGQVTIHNAAFVCAPFDPMHEPEADTFILDVARGDVQNLGLSGCSGGPVFSLPDIENPFDEWAPVLEGIIFQGYPASSEQTTKDNAEIWAIRVDKRRMECWLAEASRI